LVISRSGLRKFACVSLWHCIEWAAAAAKSPMIEGTACPRAQS